MPGRVGIFFVRQRSRLHVFVDLEWSCYGFALGLHLRVDREHVRLWFGLLRLSFGRKIWSGSLRDRSWHFLLALHSIVKLDVTRREVPQEPWFSSDVEAPAPARQGFPRDKLTPAAAPKLHLSPPPRSARSSTRIAMFHEGNLQSGISVAIQEQKLVGVFVRGNRAH